MKMKKRILSLLLALVMLLGLLPKAALASNDIHFVLSIDAQTLGLGYLVEPTILTVPSGTSLSQVIADQRRTTTT